MKSKIILSGAPVATAALFAAHPAVAQDSRAQTGAIVKFRQVFPTILLAVSLDFKGL